MYSHRRFRFVKGVAAVAATAITFSPTVNPPAAAGDPPAVQRTATLVTLSAQSTPLALPVDAPALLTDWIQRVIVPPSFGAPIPTPQFPPIVAPTSIGTSIKGIYNAVEPWVQYGFDLAAYAVGWVPYVGWLAPQITIFYHFGERIARSITFNIADWLDGRISFGQGLVNVGVDTFNSFVQLGIDQWNFWLPSLPPLPPFPFASTPPEPTAIEPLTTAVDSLAVAAASEGNTGPKPKTNGDSSRPGTTTDESRTTSDTLEIATVKPPRGERADSATRKPVAEAGAELDSQKTGSVKPGGPKAREPKAAGPKADGPKGRTRNDK
jgi:hypothetical protein